MGVLDDAIRQHLELKRKRGADPSEVKREEDEALGKVVQAERPVAGEQVTAAPLDEAPAPADAEALDSIAHQPTQAFDPAEVAEALGRMPADDIGEPELEPEAEPEPEPESEPEAEPVAEPQHSDEIEPDSPEPDEGPAPATEEPVAEAEAAQDELAEDEDPDELEQTPDFLEDAPEHDKLWFEQKPPKDFDF